MQGPNADPSLRWKLLQRRLWVNGVDSLFDYFASMLDYELSLVASQISCPTLLTAAEGAGGHCEATARILYHQRGFDWLDETLGV